MHPLQMPNQLIPQQSLLHQLFHGGFGGQGALDWQVATLVGEMLAETPSPPPLRQAL